MGFFSEIAPALPIVGAGVGAAYGGVPGAAAGGQAGGMFSTMIGQQDANKANVQLGKDQMTFQERMSNTAFQRQMNDLRNAGLNPMMASSMGGSSTPSGSSPQVSNVFSDMNQNISSAADSARLKKELDATDSQISVNDAIKETQQTQADLNVANAKNAKANEETTRAELPAVRAQSRVAQQQAKADIKKAEFNEKAATYDSFMDRIVNGLGGVSSALGRLFRPSSTPNPRIQKRGNGNVLMNPKTGEILKEY